MDVSQIVAVAVFVVVMITIMTEKLHRSLAAITGAMIVLALHVMPFDAAMEHIDFNTLGVLLGMMLFVSVVKLSGVFEFLAIKCARLAKGDPWKIMLLFVLLTAVLSAFLDNVTTVLLIGPMTLTVCKLLDVNPIPFFMTEILASNIGGTATLIGDPPNIMIGSAANLSFFDFIIYDAPCVLLIMAAVLAIFYFMYGRKLGVNDDKREAVMHLVEADAIHDRSLFHKSVIMIVVVAAAFVTHGFFHIEPSVIALAAAGIMLVISGADMEKTIREVEWTTIGFFAGLFVVVGGMAETGVIQMMAEGMMELTGGDLLLTLIILVWASAIISSILDNIPLVATLIPIITTMGASGVDVAPLWWAISLGACLGGCGTLIGASANVVMASISERHGYPLSFMEYTKVGFPIMIVCTAIACVYLIVRFVVLV